MNRDREAHLNLPMGAVRIQAFCRARCRDLVYLGRQGPRFKIAATTQGAKTLADEGFRVKATSESVADKTVVIVQP